MLVGAISATTFSRVRMAGQIPPTKPASSIETTARASFRVIWSHIPSFRLFAKGVKLRDSTPRQFSAECNVDATPQPGPPPSPRKT